MSPEKSLMRSKSKQVVNFHPEGSFWEHLITMHGRDPNEEHVEVLHGLDHAPVGKKTHELQFPFVKHSH